MSENGKHSEEVSGTHDIIRETESLTKPGNAATKFNPNHFITMTRGLH